MDGYSEEPEEDVYRVLSAGGQPTVFVSVHGYRIQATDEQQARIRRLTVDQRHELLLRLAVLRPSTQHHDPEECDTPGCKEFECF